MSVISRNERAAAAAGTGRDIVAFAVRAPSIHNTQPWLWRVDGTRLELYADRRRQLPVADPEGRHLAISCGAALQHAVVRARVLGQTCEVTQLPSPRDPDHLETVHLYPGRPDQDARAECELLARRRTDRRRFTAWPLPEDRLDELTSSVEVPGTTALTLREAARRVRVGLLVSRALLAESSDPRYGAEQARWTEPTVDGGVPETHRPTPHPRLGVSSRYDDPAAESLERDAVQGTDGLIVITTEQDGPRDWLRTGVLLCRLWTGAMSAGLSVVPLSQVVEVAETRSALAEELSPAGVAAAGHPQLLLRLGWQEISRNPLPPTGRRGVDEVLLP